MDVGSIGGLVAFLIVVALIVYVARNPEKVKAKLGGWFGGTSKGDGDGSSGSTTDGRRYRK